MFLMPFEDIQDDVADNQYTRQIAFDEVFPQRQRGQVILPEISFDLAYYPDERGPYNYNNNPADYEAVGDEARLRNPERNFGAITKAITHDVDFDNINIQYIEFWMMDPFIDAANGGEIRPGEGNDSGGDFYINLGNISEDVTPDGDHFFENGLTVDRVGLDSSHLATTRTRNI